MASTTSSVRSVRLPNDVWAQLVTEAEKRGSTVNYLLHSFAIVGLLKAAEGRAVLAKPAEKGGAEPAPSNPPKLNLPILGQFERKPMPKTPKR
jgi:hypothetical protein